MQQTGNPKSTMPPLRRYLRITKYSVLECRIYLDNPADTQRWLLNSRDPVLPRVIEAVRPLVLPKLREENARTKSGKGGKKKGWKDVVVEDNFEVAVFLTETSSRHAILKKDKRAKREKPRLGTTKGRLAGFGTKDVPVEIGDDGDRPIFREESQEEVDRPLADIPVARDRPTENASRGPEREEEDPLFVSEGSDNEGLGSQANIPVHEVKAEPIQVGQEDGDDDKKKMALETMYDGFTIYGRILCLVVKRRGTGRGKDSAQGAGPAMMEEWIASTQAGEGQILED